MSGLRNERSISIMNLDWDKIILGLNSQFEILMFYVLGQVVSIRTVT